MYVIFFLSDDFQWTKETSQKVFYFFKMFIGFHKASVYVNNQKFIKDIENVVAKYEIYNEDVTLRILKTMHEEDFRIFINNSNLILLDENLREEIVPKIFYDYKGKFKFLW